MGQIIKPVFVCLSVCLSVCQCIRLWALSRSHFLIDFHQNWHRRKKLNYSITKTAASEFKNSCHGETLLQIDIAILPPPCLSLHSIVTLSYVTERLIILSDFLAFSTAIILSLLCNVCQRNPGKCALSAG